MRVTINELTYEELAGMPGFRELCSAYRSETGLDGWGDGNPDGKAYETMSAAGLARYFAACDASGALVGIAVGFVVPHLHYSKSYLAVEAIFVDPRARAFGVGARLLSKLIAFGRERGGDHVILSAKPGSNFDSELSSSKSFSCISHIYARKI